MYSKEIAFDALDVTPANMDDAANGLDAEQRRIAAEALEAVAMAATWRSAYLDSRYGGGCGDQGHDAAVKAANKALAGLRKVLGYTYPERAAIHV